VVHLQVESKAFYLLCTGWEWEEQVKHFYWGLLLLLCAQFLQVFYCFYLYIKGYDPCKNWAEQRLPCPQYAHGR